MIRARARRAIRARSTRANGACVHPMPAPTLAPTRKRMGEG